jgi:hypothetical protein
VEAGPIAVRVGDLVIGVRTNDEEMSALLARAVRPQVEAGVDAPPNLSLTFGAADGRLRDRHLLYRSGVSVVRTSSRGRVLRGALRYLASYAPIPSDMTGVNAKLLLRDDDALLVDARFGVTVDVLERRLQRLGLRVLDVHTPLLDPETLDIRVQAPRLEVDPDGRAAIDREYPPAPQEVEVQSGSYRLAGIVAWGDEASDGRSPARRFTELTPLVVGRHGRIAPADLDTLMHVSGTCEIVRIPVPDVRQLVQALRTLARSSR